MNANTESDEATTSRVIASLPIGLRPLSRTSDIYKEVLLDWVQQSVAYLLFFIVLQVALLIEAQVDPAFIPLFALNLKIIVFHVCSKRGSSLSELVFSMQVINELTSIAFKILLLIHKNNQGFNAIFIIVPVGVSFVNQLIHKPSKSEECRYLTWMIITVSKTLFLLTVLNVALKVEEIIDWSLPGVFWPIYIGICICGVIIIGIVLFTLGSILSWSSDEITTKELVSTIWLLILMIGITSSLLILCFSATGMKKYTFGKYFCLLPASVLGYFIISTWLNLKNITEWWIMFFTQNSVEDSSDQEQQSAENLEQPSLQTRIIKEVKRAPRFLMRISSNYFKPTEKPKVYPKRTESLKEHISDVTILPRRTFSGPSLFVDVSEKSSPSASGMGLCEMCCDKKSNAVIMDCGHGGICYECSLELWKSTGYCHMCRASITQVLQIEKTKEKVVKVKSITRAVYETDVINSK